MAVRSATLPISLPRLDRRHVIAGLLAAVAGVLVLVVTQPPDRTPVLVAAQDLAAGHRLASGDVAVRHVENPEGHIQGDALGELEGFAIAVPLRSGEPLIPSAVQPPAVVEATHQISVAVPVDRAALGRITPGSVVDIYATTSDPIEGVSTVRVAEGVHVIDAERAESAGLRADITLLLAVDDELAVALTNASHAGVLDVVLVER